MDPTENRLFVRPGTYRMLPMAFISPDDSLMITDPIPFTGKDCPHAVWTTRL